MIGTLDYKIVYKTSIPKKQNVSAKWRPIFDPLPINKAVVFTLSNQRDANKQGSSIRTSLNRMQLPYTTHFRTIPNGDKFSLYVWKELATKETPNNG